MVRRIDLFSTGLLANLDTRKIFRLFSRHYPAIFSVSKFYRKVDKFRSLVANPTKETRLGPGTKNIRRVLAPWFTTILETSPRRISKALRAQLLRGKLRNHAVKGDQFHFPSLFASNDTFMREVSLLFFYRKYIPLERRIRKSRCRGIANAICIATSRRRFQYLLAELLIRETE